MTITTETLHKIAHLARLEIKPEEETDLIASLQEVLNWMEQLTRIDTREIAPLTHMTDHVNVWREDEGRNTLDRDKALANAPDHTAVYFKVPKVIE